MNNYHRLLRRQLKKAGFDGPTLERMGPFLQQVNKAYRSFDADMEHFETILEKSSQELFLANQQLKQNFETVTTQLAKVVDNIQEVIFEIDLEGRWSYLNPAWERLTGYPVSRCLGHHYSEVLETLDGNTQKYLLSLPETPFETVRRNIRIKANGEDERWLDLSLKTLRDADDAVKGYIGTITDITNLKEVELALMEAKERATQANNAKADFLSTMSHEIRTPLNAVIGLSHLLLLENPDERQLESLHALKYSSEHLLGLINDILDFNKIESGAIDLEEAPFSFEGMLDGLYRIFGQKAREKNIQFQIKRDNALPGALIGDRTRIFQILANLISNAIKFTERGKVVLDIEVAKDKKDRVLLDFDVRDSGIGIPEDKLDTIFESFVQANSSTTRKYGGTGLGLPICKRLLEIMDGTLMVTSEEGKGSSFRFFLELAVPKAEELTERASIQDLSAQASLKDIRVLVAEDNAMNILVIRKFFERWGIHSDIAEDGRKAVAMAAAKNYDIILMDLQMPVMNGYQAATAIRKSSNPNNQGVPIFALSASAGIDIKNKVRDFGMDGHISKPFNPAELHQTLEKIVFNL